MNLAILKQLKDCLTLSRNICTCNLGGFEFTVCLTTLSTALAVLASREARLSPPFVCGSDVITLSEAATDAFNATIDLLFPSPERILSPVIPALLRHLSDVDVEGDKTLFKRREEEERRLEAPSNLVVAIVSKV